LARNPAQLTAENQPIGRARSIFGNPIRCEVVGTSNR